MIKAKILVPLLNANEPEARLVSIHVADRQMVASGMILFTIETTKAVSEIETSESGYVRILAAEGEILEVGKLLAVVTETSDEPLELPTTAAGFPTNGGNEPISDQPNKLRITKPARALAESLGFDLSVLPKGILVTEEVVRKFAQGKNTRLFAATSGKTLYIDLWSRGARQNHYGYDIAIRHFHDCWYPG